jgi:hypothetical protein
MRRLARSAQQRMRNSLWIKIPVWRQLAIIIDMRPPIGRLAWSTALLQAGDLARLRIPLLGIKRLVSKRELIRVGRVPYIELR